MPLDGAVGHRFARLRTVKGFERASTCSLDPEDGGNAPGGCWGDVPIGTYDD